MCSNASLQVRSTSPNFPGIEPVNEGVEKTEAKDVFTTYELKHKIKEWTYKQNECNWTKLLLDRECNLIFIKLSSTGKLGKAFIVWYFSLN